MSEPLWTPSAERIKATNMYRFMQQVNQAHEAHLNDYDALHQWW